MHWHLVLSEEEMDWASGVHALVEQAADALYRTGMHIVVTTEPDFMYLHYDRDGVKK